MPWLYDFYGSDGGRPSGASIFVSGFVLGGIIVGTLGCVYAPQVMTKLQYLVKSSFVFLLFVFVVAFHSYVILLN